MKPSVTVITPEIEAGTGGVADYTLRLVDHWPAGTDVQILSRRPWHQSGGAAVADLPRSETAILEALKATTTPVLVQYSAFGFEDDGKPDAVINALLRWKSSGHSQRLVIMFHEIWMFVPFWNRRFFAQRQHREAIGRLARAADLVVTSTASQASHLEKISGRKDISVLPVGSNIDFKQTDVPRRAESVGIIFGLEQSRLRTFRRLHKDLRELARAKRLRRVVTIGPGDAIEEAAVLENLKLADGFQQLGPCPESLVAREFASATFGISDQDPLSYAKSGTLMAYTQHGLNVISPFASATVSEPFSLFVAPSELMRGVSRDQLDGRANSLQAWQARTSSWQKIADFFADALQLSNPEPPAIPS